MHPRSPATTCASPVEVGQLAFGRPVHGRTERNIERRWKSCRPASGFGRLLRCAGRARFARPFAPCLGSDSVVRNLQHDRADACAKLRFDVLSAGCRYLQRCRARGQLAEARCPLRLRLRTKWRQLRPGGGCREFRLRLFASCPVCFQAAKSRSPAASRALLRRRNVRWEKRVVSAVAAKHLGGEFQPVFVSHSVDDTLTRL